MDYDAFTLRQIDATLADSDAGELCFAIEVFDDGFVEEEECFTFNINLGGISDDMIDIAPGQESSTCCIIDDDRECDVIKPVCLLVYVYLLGILWLLAVVG